MDVTVLDPAGVTITWMDVNANNGGTPGAVIGVEVFVTPWTYVGKELTASAWTSVSSGYAVSQAENLRTRVDVLDFTLAHGKHGVLVQMRNGLGPAYTVGTGTNQIYSNGKLRIDLGAAQSQLWKSHVFKPRVWNGAFCTGPISGFSTYCEGSYPTPSCNATMRATGTPSASATSGFTVLSTLAWNNRFGLLLYKANGARAATPYQCGLLCIGPWEIRRTPARSSGGNPPPAKDCSGVYSIDMNAFAAGLAGGQPDPALRIPGTVVHCQWFGRYPTALPTCQMMMTPGGEYAIEP